MKRSLSILAALVAFCCAKSSTSEEVSTENYSLVSASNFFIARFPLRTRLDSLVSILGPPDRKFIHVNPIDSIHSILYLVDGAEMMFAVRNDTAIFSSLYFNHSDYTLENSMASFSAETEIDAIRNVFPESYRNRTKIEGQETLHLKVEEYQREWIRLIFVDGQLSAILYNYRK